jgi:predicted aldo/keto reductase-like oxidoreductase
MSFEQKIERMVINLPAQISENFERLLEECLKKYSEDKVDRDKVKKLFEKKIWVQIEAAFNTIDCCKGRSAKKEGEKN